MLGGIVCGLFTALFQDMGYIASRTYVRKRNDPAGLLIHAQILMGASSLPLLIGLLLLKGMPDSGDFLVPLILVAAGSGGGQYFFFRAERRMAPEQVSTLMGLRVVLLALISAGFLGASYAAVQWTGIALAAVSAGVMNRQGRKFDTGGMKDLAFSLVCYCVSDLNVSRMVHGFGFVSSVTGSLFALCLVNLLTALILTVRLKRGTAAEQSTMTAFRESMPYASSWTLKQFFLYLCYALIGPVHGNVVLSVRGPLAVALALLRKREKDSPPVTRSVWIKRGAATLMMTGAILLYTVG